MFHPVSVVNGNLKSRTQYMLGAGGRVVRATTHDPAVDNRLIMVPLESELKAMLYDQVCSQYVQHCLTKFQNCSRSVAVKG